MRDLFTLDRSIPRVSFNKLKSTTEQDVQYSPFLHPMFCFDNKLTWRRAMVHTATIAAVLDQTINAGIDFSDFAPVAVYDGSTAPAIGWLP